MKIIEPTFYIEDKIDGNQILKKLEKAARVCYKSEAKITDNSAKKMIKSLIDKGHESVLEHEKITVRIICDRGVTHELVRHRIASFSQESTRYCNYSSDKFGNELTFIKPCFWDNKTESDKTNLELWETTMQLIERTYIKMLELGATPQEARSILPNSLKTEIIVTMNIREWRHFLKLRTDIKAHPQMIEIASKILIEFKNLIPVLFDDILIND